MEVVQRKQASTEADMVSRRRAYMKLNLVAE